MKNTVLDLMKADHASVRRLLDLLDESALGSADRRELLATRLGEVVAEHLGAEERTVYLALADDADPEIGAAMQDHVLIRALLGELSSAPPDGHAWLARAAELRRLLERHMRREEVAVYPAVSNITPEKLDALAPRFRSGLRRRRIDS